MSRTMSKSDVVEMCVNYFPSFLRSRSQAIRVDKWVSGKQYELNNEAGAAVDVDPEDPFFGLPFSPSQAEVNAEYQNLRGLSPNNFAGLIVSSLAQTAYVEGIRRPGVKGNLPAWDTWQRNRWDSKQTAVHRATIGMGEAYGVVIPGTDPLTGDKMAKMLAKSLKTMSAFYDNDDDEWPVLAIEAHPVYEKSALMISPIQTGWTVTVYDSYVLHYLSCEGNGETADKWKYIEERPHGMPVPPVARCVNRVDLDGRTTGEIEPVLPLLRRIDQDVFDRLIVQRFGAWQVRYISGMAKPQSQTEQAAQALRLSIEDLLVSDNHETKFGVLPGQDPDGFIKVTDEDLRLLSAVTQTPPHHLLGLSSNLQAEALAAAESGLQRKSYDFRINAGEFHEQMARLSSMAQGDMDNARAFDLQVRWKDTESRSFAQTVQALGLLATQLKVPLEMLWETIPGWTDTDVVRAKELVEDGTFEAMIQAMMANTGGDQTQQDAQAQGGGGSGGDANA